jgi:glycosyltransferase involved in cell wall biosynthesis
MRLLSPLAWLAMRGDVTFGLVTEGQLRSSRREFASLRLRGGSFRRKVRLRAEKSLREADIVILQRSTSPMGARARALARAGGAGLVYDSDDNFLVIDPNTPEVGAYYGSPAVRRHFVDLLAGADIVTTTTIVLADAFAEFAADVRILPSCMDFAHVDTNPRREATSALVIGYAGTVTHGSDFECVEPALRRVLDEGQGAVRLQFFGYAPDNLLGLPDVDFVPYNEDYPSFLRALSQVDWSFGIAPLADLPSRRGKSNNKYREYGGCRIPAVYSDCPAYSGSVADGRTGLLVPHTEKGWYAGLQRMMADRTLRESMACAAHEDVMERYSVAAAAQAWLGTFQDLLSRESR